MKFQLNLPHLGYNKVFQTSKIRHYGPVCDISETDLYSEDFTLAPYLTVSKGKRAFFLQMANLIG